MGLNPLIGELVREGSSDTHTEGSWPCEVEAATGVLLPQATEGQRGLRQSEAGREAWKRFSLRVLTLTSDFWPSELGDDKYPLFEATKFVVIYLQQT